MNVVTVTVVGDDDKFEAEVGGFNEEDERVATEEDKSLPINGTDDIETFAMENIDDLNVGEDSFSINPSPSIDSLNTFGME